VARRGVVLTETAGAARTLEFGVRAAVTGRSARELAAGSKEAGTPARSHSLSLKDLTKHYAGQVAIEDVTIEVERGRFVTLLGPSGSGKTTILMCIAGFVPPSRGEIRLDGRDITHLPPEERNFGMVFQGYALFPQMTVEENVWFPLRVRGVRRGKAQKSIKAILDLMQMGHLAHRLPAELSGGQQQRVALARALVFEPDLLLLDEPLSALDKRLRADLQWELSALHRRLGATFINVTHDQEEALSMSDDIVILREGRVEQAGSPELLYARPASQFVASFLGESNFIRGEVSSVEDDRFRYTVRDRSFVQAGAPTPRAADGSVLLALRPEKITVAHEPTNRPNSIEGQITDFKFFGSTFYLQIATELLGRIMVKTAAGHPGLEPRMNAPVWLGWNPDAPVVVLAS
jgi:putative spermidine/putrescine transport system ATP-binding protein